MTERSRGEAIREVFEIARHSLKAGPVVDVIQTRTLPFFHGSFETMVSALAHADNGPSFQGSQPDVWTSIRAIDARTPRLGTALAAVAIAQDIAPPPCGLKERGLDKMPYVWG